MRVPIKQSLAHNTSQSPFGSLRILTAKLAAVVVPEVELRKIAVQMRLRDAVVRADDAALHDGEEVF